ncbi:cupin domain-containing protein [Pseudodesulfovibrio senegalensis]|jgi:hypothetical protein|uniref:Cupin domain-containing protein n=1 Tax=Pseudodesulfovibrio senegalensis TaxID=1721087 RepID=A0A6N6N4K5_9BACT|nr:cupin domain-containing protein [Pseudodesulfovibrio senegalensis]KAB1441661.1 cupin domain-containing protein [Pseudodesulfovibrio senegalensis]
MTTATSAISAQEIIDTLGLEPHPEEGGHFRETHRAAETHKAEHLPHRYEGPRAHSTAIYYLLTPNTFSHLHRLKSEEIFHFYLGDPCEMLHLHPDGRQETVILGHDIVNGQRVQQVVPAGVWQGMRLLPGGSFALMGCTVAPGFEYRDYEHADRDALLQHYPEPSELIRLLTA